MHNLSPLRESENWPLLAAPVLTAREREFHRLLMSEYPDHLVFVQVALSQLITVIPGVLNAEWIRSRYKQLVADFVLCRMDYSIVAVIELDDSSHQRADRLDADRRKTTAVQSAGLRLVRIPPGPLPDRARLRGLIARDSRRASSAVRPPAHPQVTVPALLRSAAFVLAAFAAIACLERVHSDSEVRTPTAHEHAAETETVPPVATVPTGAKQSTETRRAAANPGGSKSAEIADDAALAIRQRKEAAWAAYFTVAPACENPATRQNGLIAAIFGCAREESSRQSGRRSKARIDAAAREAAV
jgi:hypothetical protein